MLKAMAKKNKVPLAPDALPDLKSAVDKKLSGSDLESILLGARRRALTQNHAEVTRADLEQSLAGVLPSAQGLEKEMQELSAVLECTDLDFLSDDWRSRVTTPGGREKIQERQLALRQIVRETP
jgi:SpoVK/Ycf46/Vps4 family AAA+-type ATPase